jgi:hypothetical protein
VGSFLKDTLEEGSPLKRREKDLREIFIADSTVNVGEEFF